MVAGSEIAAAAKIIQIAQQQGWFSKLKDAFVEKRPVLVLGSTGVGKTNFLESLRKLVPETIDNMNRTADAQRSRIIIDRETFMFLDTPGQIGHKGRRIDAVLQSIGTKELGVINVGCWGYHEYTYGASEATIHGKPSDSWLERHRQVELDAVSEWGHIIGSRPSWFFTLVSKSDLWWANRDAVIRHYEAGRYAELLDGFGIKNRSVFGYSSVRHPFYGVAPSSGEFDDDAKSRMQQLLLREMLRAATTRQL